MSCPLSLHVRPDFILANTGETNFSILNDILGLYLFVFDVTHSSDVYSLLVQSESSCLVRQCCGGGRPFNMSVVDNNQKEVQ